MDEVTEVSGSVTLEPKKVTKKSVTVVSATISLPPEIPYLPPEIISPVKPTKYKLNLYTSNGLLRNEISRGIFADMSRRHGDVMRAVPSGYWNTMDEIVGNYNGLVRRLRFGFQKAPEQIASAVIEMVEAGLIVMK